MTQEQTISGILEVLEFRKVDGDPYGIERRHACGAYLPPEVECQPKTYSDVVKMIYAQGRAQGEADVREGIIKAMGLQYKGLL